MRERRLVFNNQIDMSKLRPTEFPTNKDLETLGPADIKTEIENF